MAASFYGRSRLPFASPQNSPNPSLQLPGATQAAADLPAAPTSPWGRGSVFLWTFKAAVCQPSKLSLPLPCSSQAPLRPQQTFPAAPTSPWSRGSVLLRRFKAGLPAFKTRQNSPNPPLQLPGATHTAADLSSSSNKSLKLWQCPFKEVQGSRSPAFKTRQNSQTLPCSSQAPPRPRQTFPAAPTSPWGRGSVLLWRFKAASCQPSKFA